MKRGRSGRGRSGGAVVAGAGVAGSMSIASVTMANDDLTTVGGTVDWRASLGLGAAERKNISNVISAPTATNTTIVGAGSGLVPNTYSWTDGASGAGNTGGNCNVYIITSTGTTCKLTWTAPADTSTRKFRVLVGNYGAGTAPTTLIVRGTLSDASASAVTANPTKANDFVRYFNYYEITYNAASAAQTLTVDFENTGGTGNAAAEMYWSVVGLA